MEHAKDLGAGSDISKQDQKYGKRKDFWSHIQPKCYLIEVDYRIEKIILTLIYYSYSYSCINHDEIDGRDLLN